MTPFIWSQGHIGWPLFGVILFSVAWLLVTDVLWRVYRTSARKLFATAGAVWLVGILIAVALYVR